MSRRAVLGLVIVALTLVVHGRILGNGFVSLDDKQYVTENPRVAGGLTSEGARWAFTSFHQANWHPLTWLSHQLDAQLFGLRPGGHHATSLALHAAAAAALFGALSGMTGALWPPFLAAALFAVHPLHVESVAWVAERKDVLSGLFFALTLAAYLRHARRPGGWRLALVAATFALGLAAKSMLVTLPFVLLLLDWWPLGRLPGLRAGARATGAGPAVPAGVIIEKLPLLALAAAASAVTLAAQRVGGAIFPLQALPFDLRVGNAAVSLAGYVGKTLWPARLAVFYPHPGDSLSWPLAAGAAVLLLAITAVALAARGRHPWLPVGWLWFVGMLVPVVGLVQVGNQAMADRYLYLPIVGLLVAALWGAAHAARRWPAARTAAPWVAGALLAACGAASFVQAGHWRDTEAVFTHAVRVTPGGNWLAEANLGYEWQRRGENERALAHFRAALRLQPGIPDLRAGAGTALAGMGRTAEAEREYREALRIDPRHAEALFGVGYALAERGRYAEAIDHYCRALVERPDYFEAAVNLANVLALAGDAAGAAAQYERAVALKPADARGRYNYGAHLAKLGRLSAATAQFEAAAAADAGFWAAHNALGNLLMRQGRPAEAIPHYERALAANPADAGVRANLERARGMFAGR